MNETVTSTAEEVTPARAAVFENQGIPEGEVVSEEIEAIYGQALALFAKVAEPVGILSTISKPDFEVVYQGEGQNEPKTPVAEVFPRADHLALIAPVTHPWARRDVVRPQELLNEAFICRESGSSCRYIVSAALAEIGVSLDELRIVMQVGSAEALAMGVEHGIGMSFVSMLAAVSRVALGRLSIINVEGLTLQSPVEMVVSRSRAASTALTKFLEFVDQPRNRRMLQMLAEGRMV